MSRVFNECYKNFSGGSLAKPYNQYEDVYNRITGEKYRMVGKYKFRNIDKKRTKKELEDDFRYYGIDPNMKLPVLSNEITIRDAIINFLELRLVDVNTPTMTLNIDGNKAIDYFMELTRLETKNEYGESQLSMWNDLQSRKKIYEGAYMLKKAQLAEQGYWSPSLGDKIFGKLTPNHIRGGIQMSVFSVNQFKPYVAKWLYNHFKSKSVVDFSAGWGGRMVGAMSLDIDYVGIDTNKALEEPYKKIMKNYQPYTKSTTTILFQKAESVDFSKYDYDMVLTSPPYITPSGKQTEEYQNMPQYNTAEFYNVFLIPTILRCWNNLKDGGYFCLNTSTNNYEELVRLVMPTASGKIIYPVRERAGGKARVESGKSAEKYKEFIYYWYKSKSMIKQFKRTKFQIPKLSFAINTPKITSTGVLTDDLNVKSLRNRLTVERRKNA